MQRFHHDCVRTMLRINWHQQWKRKIKMKQLFAELGNVFARFAGTTRRATCDGSDTLRA